MKTVSEIENAIAGLPPAERRKLIAFLSAKLMRQSAMSRNLKEALLDFPDVGTDADFARIRETPRDVSFS